MVGDVGSDTDQYKRGTDTLGLSPVEAFMKMSKCNREAARIREILPMSVDNKQMLLQVWVTLSPPEPR